MTQVSKAFNEENQDVTVLASSERTSSENSDWFRSLGARGVRVFLDITAASGTTPTLDIKFQALDPVSGKAFDIPGASFAQKTGTETDAITVYPGIAETNNETVSDVLSTKFRAVATIGGTSPSFTFSLGATLLP